MVNLFDFLEPNSSDFCLRVAVYPTDTVTDKETKNVVHTENTNWSWLTQLDKEGAYYDVTLTVAGREFHCHRIILAARSKYFERFFETDTSMRVNLHDIDVGFNADIFEEVINFIYSDSLVMNAETVKRLLRCCCWFEVTEMRKRFLNFIEHERPESFRDLNEFCILIDGSSDEEMKVAIAKRVAQYLLTCSREDNFWLIPFEMFREIVWRSYPLEDYAFEYAVRWVKFKKEERKEQLSELLEAIDYQRLRPSVQLSLICNAILDTTPDS